MVALVLFALVLTALVVLITLVHIALVLVALAMSSSGADFMVDTSFVLSDYPSDAASTSVCIFLRIAFPKISTI